MLATFGGLSYRNGAALASEARAFYYFLTACDVLRHRDTVSWPAPRCGGVLISVQSSAAVAVECGAV